MLFSKNIIMKEKYFLPIWVISIFLNLLFASCKKFVEVDAPKNQLISEVVFKDDATATAAVTGIYSNMMAGLGIHFASNGLTIYPGMSADEFKYTTSSYDEFLFNSLTTSNTAIRTLWDEAYQYIYDANAVIEGVSNSSSITSNTRNQLLGEAKFVRAFCYFYLVNLFGDVPLVTSTNYQTNKSISRNAVAEVYETIINDLVDAEALMPASYISGDRIRPNKWTAATLLARVYLYQGNWAMAENEASKIIASPLYSLSTIPNTFLKNSNETIWQLYPVFAGFTWDAFYFIPGTGVAPNYQITNNLINSFDSSDLRKTNWIGTATVQGQTYYYPSKYKSKLINSFAEYFIVFRLAEVYLIRAEARAQQNNTLGALADLNVIRNRAGLSGSTANTSSALLNAIYHERQGELFAEWGHRWFDLKRTGNSSAVLTPLKGANWQPSDTLYPIPVIEIQNNIKLTQNTGY
jgi:hypothetical protein